LHELDGLRGLAALTVVVAHLNIDTFGETDVADVVAWTHRYNLANTAVSFFYVLSAFILTLLAVREIRATRVFSRSGFLVRRVARIWPLYWAMLGINAVLAVAALAPFGTNTESWPWLRDHLWIYTLFLGNWSLALGMQGWHVDLSPPGLAVLWSIAVEEQFYLVHALIAGVVLVSGRRVALTAALALALGCAYRAWHTAVLLPHQYLHGVYYATPSYLEMFGFGLAAGWLLATDGTVQRSVRTVLRFPPTAFLVAGLAVGVSIRWIGVPVVQHHPDWYATLAATSMALLVAWSVANRDRALVRWTVGSLPIRWLGTLSYGIYVWHPVAHGAVRWLLPDAGARGTLVVYVALTVAPALVSYFAHARFIQNGRPNLTSQEQRRTMVAPSVA
jgi:peptidoglycan/LPS O-acetylase OafA/YrhL